MPMQALTPESLMARADSKNPATTCKGLTTSGRPCRRSLGASARNSPASSPGRGRLVMATSTDAAEFYCWQHKDQASEAAESGHAQVVDLKKRSSVDSLAARLGLLDVEEAKKRHSKHGKQELASGRPQQKPPGAGTDSKPPPRPAAPAQRVRPKRREKSHISISMFCCMRASEADEGAPAIPAWPVQPKLSHETRPTPAQSTHRPPLLHAHSPIAYLPRSAPPSTIALLSAELAKPLTPSDHEPGYIYIFWVVPSHSRAPPISDTTELLAPPRSARPLAQREMSDLLRQYSVRAPPGHGRAGGRRTIMLKIGRTINVQRRMYDWRRQCGEDIMLLRSYPYQSASASSSPAPSPKSSPAPRRVSAPPSPSGAVPRKVPLMPRVERLIHLELQEQRVMRQCDGCSKQHREWFEIEASMDGVRAVDETIRRWVQWGERNAVSAMLSGS